MKLKYKIIMPFNTSGFQMDANVLKSVFKNSKITYSLPNLDQLILNFKDRIGPF